MDRIRTQPVGINCKGNNQNFPYAGIITNLYLIIKRNKILMHIIWIILDGIIANEKVAISEVNL